MSVIFLLIPLSIAIAAGFLGAFIWSVRSGQYEDTLTPSMRVLLDDSDAGRAGDRRPGNERLAEPDASSSGIGAAAAGFPNSAKS